MTRAPDQASGRGQELDRFLGRLLIVVTYVAVGLLSVGVVLLLAAGISPLAGGPPLDPSQILVGLSSLDPATFLWLGIIVVIATPISRVVVAAIGFARLGDRWMVAVSLGILAVIALGIALGTAG